MSLAVSITNCVRAVTKVWTKQRQAEERERHRLLNRREALARGGSDQVKVKEVAYELMEQAYLEASGGGRYPAKPRQMFYKARGPIQEKTDKTVKGQYFQQTLLPDYMAAYPRETADWRIDWDARGHFAEPHTGERFDLGTKEVREYLCTVSLHGYPTRGPHNRYGGILFTEKEGFDALFADVKLAERYDLATMSTKGLSTTAARTLVDDLCKLAAGGIPLFVLHDFDKAGLSILGTFRRNTRRYTFRNKVNVIDLGLRLKDVKAHRLESEGVVYKNSDPRDNLRLNGATEKEIAFLCDENHSHPWRGRRVELNAFGSAELIAWLERKLKAHGVKKIVPDATVMELAYRSKLQRRLFKQRSEALNLQCVREAQKEELPKGLKTKIRKGLKGYPSRAWDTIIALHAKEHAARLLRAHDPEIDPAVGDYVI
jgi:hypothetical protein